MIPQFLHPWVLLASLVLIPAVFGLLYLGYKAQVMARKSYGREEELISKFSKPITLRSELLRMLLWCIVAAGILFTWAGPEVSDSPTQVAAGDRDRMSEWSCSWETIDTSHVSHRCRCRWFE